MSKTPFENQYFVRHGSHATQRSMRGIGFACLAILLQSCASAPTTATLAHRAPPTSLMAMSMRGPLPLPAPPLTESTAEAVPTTSALAQIEAQQAGRPAAAPAAANANTDTDTQNDAPPVVTRASFTTLVPQVTPPSRPRAYAPALQDSVGAAPNLFGSVALVVSRTPEDGQWRRIADSRLPSSEGPWTPILERARGLPLMQQLQVVNAGVNRAITFTSDIQQYGVGDYWATARESLTNGRGDCEDYAIAKLQLLQALGVPADDLYLVLARDLDRQADHAVLAVRAEGRFWVLDSASGVMSAESVRDYRPIMTFSANHTWLHGFRRAPEVMVASAGDVGGAR